MQALGFANVNAFKIRWINVPEFGKEACTGERNGGVYEHVLGDAV